MNETEYLNAINTLISLCKCAVNRTTPEKTTYSTDELDCLYLVAKKHMLTSLVGTILKELKIENDKFVKSVAAAQSREVLYDNEYKQIIAELEKNRIWYMPLKGAVLKDLYPVFATREMCDRDILFDEKRAQDVKNIMVELGFQVKSYGKYKDDNYVKSPYLSFEMHRLMIGDRHKTEIYEYYRNVRSRLLRDDDNAYGYHLSKEDFYVFMIAHEYKHYNMGGTGLRSLLDTYIYLKNNSLDMDYVESEIRKLDIEKYEKANRMLSLKLFSGSELSESEKEMLDYILSSGAYGVLEHDVRNQIEKRGGRLRYIFKRLFGPRKDDKEWPFFRDRYALFYRYKILLPFLPAYRLMRALFKSPKRLAREIRAMFKKG